MIEVKKEEIILKKTHASFENEGVLNPAIIQMGKNMPLFYGVVSKVIIPPLAITNGTTL